jgi:hypothetical protein
MKTMNYFKKVYVALLALAVSFSLNSCGSDDDSGSDPITGGGDVTLDVALASTGVFSFAGEKRKVTVTTTGDWEASTDKPLWVTFDPLRGSGNGEFNVSVAAHTGDEERTATVTVSIDDSNVKKEITITQDKVQAYFEIKETNAVFSDLMVGVGYFWGVSPALYYKHVLIKPGTLRIQFPKNSHIHTFVMDKEPGYYEKQGDGFAATPTVDTDPTISDAYYAHVQYPGVEVKEDGTKRNQTGDIHALCPRSTPQDFSFYLKAGTYWTTHTLELDVTDETCGQDPQLDNGSFLTSEVFDLIITFTPDE